MLVLRGNGQEVEWDKSVGGVHSEYLFDVISTLDYGFILAGSSFSDKSGVKLKRSEGDLDYFVWKMDRNGKEEWQLSFGGAGQDVLKSISQTKDMGYVLGGYSNLIKRKNLLKQKKDNDIWVVKVNAKGIVEWDESYGNGGDERLVSIKQVKDGGYIIVGTTNLSVLDKGKTANGGTDYWIIKTNKKGEIEWERVMGGIYNDEPKVVVETTDGFIVGGISNSPASGDKMKENFGGDDIWILELNDKGDKVNEYTFGSESDDDVNDIIKVDDGYIITGSTYSKNREGNLLVSSKVGSDFFMIKTDLSFQSLSQRSFDFGENEILTSTAYLPNEKLLLSGYRIDGVSEKKSCISIVVDNMEEILWEKELVVKGNDLLRKSIVTRDGAIVLAGNSTGKNLKYKTSEQGRNDYWIVKLSPIEETKERKEEIKIEAFPNPTEGFTQIVVNHEYKKGIVNIFDLNGRLLHTEELRYAMVPVDLSGYPVGVYLINVHTDVINETIKVIKR